MNEDLTEYELARKRFQASAEYDAADREEAKSDKEFYAGQQWEDRIRNERTADGRPVMTLNLLPKFVRQVTGEAKMNETAIEAIPVDSTGDPSLAQVYQGLVRTIEDENSADIIYEEGLSSSAICGRGAWRIYTDYEHDMTFDQVIKMSPIPEPLSVYWDPSAKNYDKSDAEYCFVTEWVTDEEFERRYGEAGTSFNDYGDDDSHLWTTDGQKRIAEYWVKEHSEKEIWLVDTGEGYTVVSDDDRWTKEGLEAEGYEVINTRKVDVIKVVRHEMGGAGFLSRDKGKLEDPDGKYGEEFPSRYIPIVGVYGPEIRNDGEVYKLSVIRFAKTPQALYNLWTSVAAEKTSLAPRAPWLGTVAMFEGLENYWRDANTTNLSYLPYKPDPMAPGAMPVRQFADPIQAAELELRRSALDDMMHTTGLPQAALGEPGNEISGVAINARQSESDVGTIDWIKNLHRSIEHTGRIIVDMIPRVYDTERAVRMLGEDGQADFVMLNQMRVNPATGQPEVVNDLTSGRYNVRLNAGPSFKTAREQTATTLISLMQAAPMHQHLFLDLIIKNLDFKDSDKAAKRVAIAMGFEKDPDAPPPQPDPEQQLDMMNKQATLEGKLLLNEQRERDLVAEGGQVPQVPNPYGGQ